VMIAALAGPAHAPKAPRPLMQMEYLRDFLAAWKTRFFEECAARTAFLASIASIVSAIGFNLNGYSYLAWASGLALIVWLGRIAYRTLPRFLVEPSRLLGRPVEVEELSYLSRRIPVVGLLGRQAAGKTTFLNALSNSPDPARRTEKPYVRIVPSLDEPSHFVAFVDSVGQSDVNQFRVLTHCDIACIFIDHNSSDTTRQISPERLKEHLSFVRQLNTTLAEYQYGATQALLLPSKGDLWSGNQKSREIMDKLIDSCAQALQEGGAIKKVQRLPISSNRLAADVSSIFKGIRRAAK